MAGTHYGSGLNVIGVVMRVGARPGVCFGVQSGRASWDQFGLCTNELSHPVNTLAEDKQVCDSRLCRSTQAGSALGKPSVLVRMKVCAFPPDTLPDSTVLASRLDRP